MTRMVEKIAQELMNYDAVYTEPKIKNYYAMARLAIEAMREPTLEMLEAGPPEPYMDREVWAKMIDKALAE